MRRLRALDLFCGAGGASMGLAAAGFDVVGVDMAAQPRYPFAFRRGAWRDLRTVLEGIRHAYPLDTHSD